MPSPDIIEEGRKKSIKKNRHKRINKTRAVSKKIFKGSFHRIFQFLFL